MHEHLEMFSLINMNGRLYDPVLGRMLSPDIFIQEQFNTQSFNRYSYCVNNPLKYSDKNGYWFGWDDVIVWGSAAATYLWDGGKALLSVDSVLK
jgi:RHS repeat-associated protein